jgi:hypothetical protein
MRPDGSRPHAELLAPGHRLLDAVIDLIIERYGRLLKHGTMLADRHDLGLQPSGRSPPGLPVTFHSTPFTNLLVPNGATMGPANLRSRPACLSQSAQVQLTRSSR